METFRSLYSIALLILAKLQVQRVIGAPTKVKLKIPEHFNLQKIFLHFSRQGKPWGYSLADTLLFSPVLTQLGLDRCRYLFSGAAPISTETLEDLAAYGLHVMELFGMSESTGALCIFLICENSYFWRKDF